MFEDLIGAYGGRLVVAVLGVGAALLCLIGILWIVRGRRGPSPFVRGGRNRNPRLQVLDAAAVDTRRRLVLVRRDDVEHLIMIGGPTDIVIESRISPSSQPTGADGRPQETSHAAVAGGPAPHAAPTKSIPAPATRPTAAAETAAITQQRQETIREPTREPPARDIRTAQSAPVPPVNPGPSAVSVSAPVVASPAAPVIPNTTAPSQAPVAAGLSAATVVPIQRMPEIVVTPSTPALDDAAKLLDSARDRVFAERPVQVPAQSQALAPAPAARPAAPIGQHPTALGSDFEKILEEEMATNLAARDASLIGRGSRPLPQPAPATAGPLPVALRQDPPLQAEVARIFGEMSASRDK